MQNLKLIKNICFFSLILFITSALPLRAMDMNGIYECRLGWSWLTTKVEVVGYSQTYKEGYATFDYAEVDGKRYKRIYQAGFGLPGDTPHIAVEEQKDKRIKIEFRQSSTYWGWNTEGVAAVIETRSFSEKDGSKWEGESRYCEKQ